MVQITLAIPDEFLPLIDQMVAMTAAGTREMWLRTMLGEYLVSMQVQKELAPQAQSRTAELSNYWR